MCGVKRGTRGRAIFADTCSAHYPSYLSFFLSINRSSLAYVIRWNICARHTHTRTQHACIYSFAVVSLIRTTSICSWFSWLGHYAFSLIFFFSRFFRLFSRSLFFLFLTVIDETTSDGNDDDNDEDDNDEGVRWFRSDKAEQLVISVSRMLAIHAGSLAANSIGVSRKIGVNRVRVKLSGRRNTPAQSASRLDFLSNFVSLSNEIEKILFENDCW